MNILDSRKRLFWVVMMQNILSAVWPHQTALLNEICWGGGGQTEPKFYIINGLHTQKEHLSAIWNIFLRGLKLKPQSQQPFPFTFQTCLLIDQYRGWIIVEKTLRWIQNLDKFWYESLRVSQFLLDKRRVLMSLILVIISLKYKQEAQFKYCMIRATTEVVYKFCRFLN